MTTTVVQREIVVTSSAAPQVVVVTDASNMQIAVSHGFQGPRGARGQIGPAGGTAFARVSGGPLSALRVVWEDQAGVIHHLDFEDADHISLLCGLTLTAAPEAGQEVTVQRSGPVNAAGLGLVPGPVWLGQNGALTQSPPITGFDLFVGTAVASGRLYLNFSDAITLED